MNRVLVFLMLSGLAWMLQPLGGCGLTAEGMKALQLSSLIERHQSLHDGALPRSWTDLRRMQVHHRHVYPMLPDGETSYAVLPVPVPLTASGEAGLRGRHSAVVVICRTPILRSTLGEGVRGPGRHVIGRDAEGAVFWRWMDEAEVEACFAAAQRLADLPGRGAWTRVTPEVRRHLTGKAAWMAVWGMLALWSFLPLARLLRDRWTVWRWARGGMAKA